MGTKFLFHLPEADRVLTLLATMRDSNKYIVSREEDSVSLEFSDADAAERFRIMLDAAQISYARFV